jgi:hypothetical protein
VGVVALLLAGACAPLRPPGAAAAPTSGAASVLAQEPAAAPEPRWPELTPAQQEALRAGKTLEQPLSFKHYGRRYVGGVSYMLIRAEPRRVFELLNHLPTLSKVLPRTRRTTVIDRQENRVRVELEQGNSVVSTTYTVFFALEPPDGGLESHTVRFWLDPSRPHSLDDVVDLGQGVLQMLFEGRIQRSILRLPHRIRDSLNEGGTKPRVATQAPGDVVLGTEPRAR